MPNLIDGIIDVRIKIGEIEANNWSDQQITAYLNRSARRMCTAAQYLNGFVNIPLTAGTNHDSEVTLPDDVDQVIDVKWFAGSLFTLTKITGRAAKVGAKVAAIPTNYYTYTASTKLTPQVAGGDISPSEVQDFASPEKTHRGLVLGVYPPVAQSGEIHVWYNAYHPIMQHYQDACLVPEQFFDGWTAFAIAQCKKVESSFDEADIYLQEHTTASEDFIRWAMSQQVGNEGPKWGAYYPTIAFRGSSSVVIIGTNPSIVPGD